MVPCTKTSPATEGKNHRVIGILRKADRNSTLTLRKLKLLHLSWKNAILRYPTNIFHTECQTSHFMPQFVLRTQKLLTKLIAHPSQSLPYHFHTALFMLRIVLFSWSLLSILFCLLLLIQIFPHKGFSNTKNNR